MQLPTVLDLVPEPCPARVGNGLGKPPVAHQIAYLQVLQGNQVVRRDERARRFAGEILALPLELSGPTSVTLNEPITFTATATRSPPEVDSAAFPVSRQAAAARGMGDRP
jgi:hypothetical protein